MFFRITQTASHFLVIEFATPKSVALWRAPLSSAEALAFSSTSRRWRFSLLVFIFDFFVCDSQISFADGLVESTKDGRLSVKAAHGRIQTGEITFSNHRYCFEHNNIISLNCWLNCSSGFNRSNGFVVCSSLWIHLKELLPVQWTRRIFSSGKVNDLFSDYSVVNQIILQHWSLAPKVHASKVAFSRYGLMCYFTRQK